MLQQTQVATVIPYYQRWLEHFPTLRDLAQAPLDDVLKLWEGLGYYRRARLLHQAAQSVENHYRGTLPRTYAELRTLPGIGSYTAAAIASIAFGEAVLAVDGNVRRVAARLFMLPGQPDEATINVHLEPHLPADDPGAFNEALMELGATVCSPKAPACSLCPLSDRCAAYRADQVEAFPHAKARRNMPHLERYALVHDHRGALWLRQRAPEEMLGGLWGFPLAETSPPELAGKRLPKVRHAYTHFKITVTPVLVSSAPGDGRYVLVEDLDKLALSKLDHKILERWRNAKGRKEPLGRVS